MQSASYSKIEHGRISNSFVISSPNIVIITQKTKLPYDLIGLNKLKLSHSLIIGIAQEILHSIVQS